MTGSKGEGATAQKAMSISTFCHAKKKPQQTPGVKRNLLPGTFNRVKTKSRKIRVTSRCTFPPAIYTNVSISSLRYISHWCTQTSTHRALTSECFKYISSNDLWKEDYLYFTGGKEEYSEVIWLVHDWTWSQWQNLEAKLRTPPLSPRALTVNPPPQ